MIDSVSVVADEGVGQTELADRVAGPSSATDVEVLTGAEITEENQDDIEQGLSFFTGFLTAFAVIALVVGSFVIYNTLQRSSSPSGTARWRCCGRSGPAGARCSAACCSRP